MDRLTRPTLLLLVALPALAAPAMAQAAARSYVAYRAPRAPRIDGLLDDAAWRAAPWSDAFVDIAGDRRPAPRFRTRVKLLWDDTCLYVAAELEEPHVWGTIVKRDSVIFHDNDFELFIDPDGDAREYAELEINALNTVWDLFLTIPYRDGGRADDAWNIEGLRTAVRVAGTLNDPADRDSGWTAEIAIPWRSLERASHTTSAPRPGARWRVNFSRVEWQAAAQGGGYRKLPGLREDNWVWSPQGMIDMHQPERWGVVELSPLRVDRRPAGETSRAAPASEPALVLSGYLADVSGEILEYHSPHPEAESALLARARREVQSVTWRTDTVPASLDRDTVEFVWIAGIAGSKGLHSFEFLVNGQRWLAFRSIRDSTVRDWTVGGLHGATLSFQHTLVDRFEDVFGYMTFRIARRWLVPGLPLTLRVVGEDASSQDWYMTFRHRLAARPRVAQDPVLVRAGTSAEAQVRVILDNLARYREASVEVAGHAPLVVPLAFGGNVIRAPAGPPRAPATPGSPASPGASSETRIVVRFDGAVALDTMVPIRPVAQRDVYLLPHSHNDIGYSDVQQVVERKQWRNIEDALREIERTRGYLAEARQKWNVEILWPVESWLAQASPAQRERFFTAVREGNVGLNAFYAGVLSGLATAPEMTHFFDYARRLRAEYGLPITTAQISDIPGQSWGIVTALAESGIRYFAMGPNTGDRIGHVLEDWGDRPFYWVSQSGRDTVLTWVAGSGYSQFHFARIAIAGERKLFQLMRRLGETGYPYRQVQLPYSVDGDNGPLDTALSDYVRDWNERYVSPRLVIATHAQLFRDFEASHRGQPSVVRGDFTGYWEDGVASTARETALARAASSRLTQAEALWAMIAPAAVPRDDFAAAWRNVVLWDEHTWGAAASVETPDAPDVIAQWRYKQAFAVAADSASRSLLARALERRGASVPGAFDVLNTAAWARTDVVLVPAELSRAGDRVVDQRGGAVPSQRLSTGELGVLVSDVPSRGYRRFTIRAGRPVAPAHAVRASGQIVADAVMRLALDSASGAIARLMRAADGTELVDRRHRSGLAQYLYVLGRDSAAAASPNGVRIQVGEPGPLVASLLVEAEAPGARSWRQEVRMAAGLGRVDIITTIDKSRVREREAVHLAFPFLIPDGQVRYDVAGAVVRADSDQLRGANRNYVSVQGWVDVSNSSRGVTWATPDAPLVEIGGMWAELPWLRSLPPSQTLYAYVMNNYWHTNYKADQEGPVTFRFAIQPHGAFDAGAAERFGAEQREPLLVAPAAGARP